MKNLNEFERVLEEKIEKILNDAQIMNTKMEAYQEVLDLIREETPKIEKEEIEYELPKEEKKMIQPPISPYKKPQPFTPAERFEAQRSGTHHQQPWTKSDIQYLIELHEKGHPDLQIADLMGRTTQSISRRRTLMGIYRQRPREVRKWTKTDVDILKGMHLNGFRKKQIATRLKRDHKAISNKIHNLKRSGEL